jgi:hypothetical protein
MLPRLLRNQTAWIFMEELSQLNTPDRSQVVMATRAVHNQDKQALLLLYSVETLDSTLKRILFVSSSEELVQ